MARRVSALYQTRALAEVAAGRLTAAGLGDIGISIAEQSAAPGTQAGMFDRLASILAPDGAAQENGFMVSTEVAPEQIDAAAIALETGAERVEVAPPPRLTEQVVEMSETAEQLVIEKQAVVREEIVMRVQAKEHVQDIHETLRRTEVDVERFGPGEDRAAT